MLARCLSPLILFCVHGKCRNPMQSLLFSVGVFDVPEIDGLCCWFNADRISFSTLHSHNLVSQFPFQQRARGW